MLVLVGGADITGLRLERSAGRGAKKAGALMAEAAFGAGGFCVVESAFRLVHGVTEAAVGYMGGIRADPTYQDLCTDRTAHPEVV